MLELIKLHKSYQSDNRNVSVLRNISLQVQPGEFVAIVGPSGSGKSTLLRLMAGLDQPSSGSLEYRGKAITGPSAERGLVFQQFALFPWLTVEQNIAFGLKLQNLSPTQIRETVTRYLQIVGLERVRRQLPKTLSGGMQQRVAIARTLANSSSLILLDEPFGALDVQTRSQMQEFLAKLWELEHRTTILVTHDVEEAIYLADRVYVLGTNPGEIIETVTINVPRPRRSEIRFSDEFIRLKKHLTYAIRSEGIKASWSNHDELFTKQVTIGLHIWPGVAPLFVAKEQGLLSRPGFQAEFISLEKESDRVRPWLHNEVDTIVVTLDAAVALKERVPDLKIVQLLNRSWGGDALVGLGSISSIVDLVGKRVAVEPNWVSHFFLHYLLDQASLAADAVTIVPIKGSDIGAALVSGRVDAAVLWEPWLSKVRELVKLNIVASTTDYPVIYDVLIAKESRLKDSSIDWANLREAWGLAIAQFSRSPIEATRVAAAWMGLSENELADQLQELQFSPPVDQTELERVVRETQKILKKTGRLTKQFSPADLFIGQ